MEQYIWVLWAAAVILFAVVEAGTVNLVSVWFVGGALAALAVSLLGGTLWLQITVFFAVSVILLASLRPFVRKYVTPKKTATNADMVLGQEAYVLEAVDNLRGTGAVKLGGKVWTARSLHETALPEGTLVKVVKIEGVKLYVEPAAVTAGV